jgi:HK97 family phage portal protein
MSLITRALANTLDVRAAMPGAEWGSSVPPPPLESGGWGTGGIVISQESAFQISTVYSCVNLISSSIANSPVLLLNNRVLRKAKELKPSPLLTEPYAEISLFEWIVQFIASLAVRGNFFGQIISRDSKTLYPTQIKPIPPDSARVERLRNGELVYRFFNKVVPTKDVFHVKLLTMPGMLEGINPIRAQRLAFAKSLAQSTYGLRYFENSANPSLVIQVKGDLSPDQTKKMVRSFIAAHQGLNSAHLPAIVTGDTEIKPITITPQDSQFLESLQWSASEIASTIYRVPPHMVGLTEKVSCLPADAQVFTTQGPRPICEIQAGDEVWSLGEDGIEAATVVSQQLTGHKPLLSIQTLARTIKLTANHVLPVRRYFGRTEGRSVGDCGWETVWIRADEVTTDDFLLTPHGFGEQGEEYAPNGRQLTVGAMELCGLYTGDGSQDKNRFEIAHESKPDHMEHYCQVIRDEFGTEPYVDNAAARGVCTGTRTRFSSVEARELFEDCGFTGNAHTKRVPGWVYELKPELQLAYLRGYLDADGSVNKAGAITFSSCNRLLLEDVRHLCMQVGVPTGRVCLGRPAGEGMIAGHRVRSHVKYQLALGTVFFNSRIGANSVRKRARLVTRPAIRRGRYDENWTGGNVSRWEGRRQSPSYEWKYDDVILQRVTKIDRSKVEVPVYDLAVANTHTFLAEGVVVHNSWGRLSRHRADGAGLHAEHASGLHRPL